MIKKLITSISLLALLCFTVRAQDKMSIQDAAKLSLDALIEEQAESYPLTIGNIRIEKAEIQGDCFVYDCVIPVFSDYQNAKNSVPKLKRSYLETAATDPQMGLLMAIVSDLGLNFRYVFHSGARTDSFLVELSSSEMIQQLGGSITKDVRMKAVYEYFDFLFSREDSPMIVSLSEKGLTDHVNQASMGLESTDIPFEKFDAQSIIYDDFVERTPGCFLYFLSMYLDVPYIFRLIFLDKTEEVSLSSSEVYEQYLRAMQYVDANGYLERMPVNQALYEEIVNSANNLGEE